MDANSCPTLSVFNEVQWKALEVLETISLPQKYNSKAMPILINR